jgi:subfamily B ATP-binding cassette protein MsbA
MNMDGNLDQTSRHPLLRFLSYLKPHARLVVGAALTGIGKFTLPLAFPMAFKYVVDVLVSANPHPDRLCLKIDHWCLALSNLLGLGTAVQGKLAALSIVLLMAYGVQAVASYYRNYWAGLAGHQLIHDLQCKLFAHMQRLPHSFFDRNPAGAVVSRVLNDVSRANELIESAFVDVWTDAVTLLVVVALLFAMDWRLALVALAIAPFWVVFIRIFSPRIKAVSHRMQEKAAEITGEVHERVVGATTVKSFGAEEREVRHFQKQGTEMYHRSIDKVRLAASQEMLIQLLTRSAPAVVLWVGALMIVHGTTTLGTLMAFFLYVQFVYMPLERFAQVSIVVSGSLAAIERMFSFLDLKPEIADHPLARAFQVKRGNVDFEGVHFGYPTLDGSERREVLKGIDLHIPGGYRVALVGRSGAGKTTLASLIPRFYDVTGGRVLIDGKDVRHYTLKALRGSVSLVTQDALLFSASVRENLLYARADATDKMMWQALEQANLREFVEQLPDQLDTIIGERGVKVSGGQRQRLAIARAFLKNSKIVILDEATSAVDSESENLIHEAIERLMEGRTVFLIAHRLRSAVTADLIIALDQGTVAEVGTHSELLRRNGTYARLYREQTRGLILTQQYRESEVQQVAF